MKFSASIFMMVLGGTMSLIYNTSAFSSCDKSFGIKNQRYVNRLHDSLYLTAGMSKLRINNCYVLSYK